jgi:hypothetical protein
MYATSLTSMTGVMTRRASCPTEILRSHIPVRIHIYFNFANISFEDSRVETSASKVFLCGTSAREIIGQENGGRRTYPVLVYDPHVLRDSLSIIRLRFYLSDLVQVQSCELKFLFTLGNLFI